MSDKPVIGLALGSGGARGLAHAGVLAALEDAGLQPPVISGSSMGAVVGGLYAETGDAAATWRRLSAFARDPEFLETWTHFIARGSGEQEQLGFVQSFFGTMVRKLMTFKTLTRPALADEAKLLNPLKHMFTARDFAELKLTFAAVAVDLISGRKVEFREGDLIDAIYASSAIPGVFPPVRRNGAFIVDGGVLFRVPIDTCRDLGADFVIAVDLPAFESSKPEYRTGLEIMMRADTLAKMRLNEFVLETADLVISPEVSAYHWADFRRADECRERGYEATTAALPALREALDRRRGWRSRLRRLIGRDA
ncbi:patatin-like phospholipase family protein, partial [bacterium]|nr:patatin-like phospholipase family protein [bacterium]